MIETQPPEAQLRALVARLTAMLETAGPAGIAGAELDLDRLGAVLDNLRIARGQGPDPQWGAPVGMPDRDAFGPGGLGNAGDLIG